MVRKLQIDSSSRTHGEGICACGNTVNRGAHVRAPEESLHEGGDLASPQRKTGAKQSCVSVKAYSKGQAVVAPKIADDSEPIVKISSDGNASSLLGHASISAQA